MFRIYWTFFLNYMYFLLKYFCRYYILWTVEKKQKLFKTLVNNFKYFSFLPLSILEKRNTVNSYMCCFFSITVQLIDRFCSGNADIVIKSILKLRDSIPQSPCLKVMGVLLVGTNKEVEQCAGEGPIRDHRGLQSPKTFSFRSLEKFWISTNLFKL